MSNPVAPPNPPEVIELEIAPAVVALEIAPPMVELELVNPTVEVEVDPNAAAILLAAEQVIREAGPAQVVFAAVPGARGQQGPGGAGSVTIGAAVNGTKDGANVFFTLPEVYIPESTGVYRNGLRERRGIDYSESAPGELTFTTAPLATDTLSADYTVA